MGIFEPLVGKVTFESEGQESGPYYSRKLHVPTENSGLTIGRGYDLKTKNSDQIFSDLVKAGVSEKDSKVLSKASALFGESARIFVKNHGMEEFEISKKVKLNLFNITYCYEESEAKRICTKGDVVRKYGKCNWSTLDKAIKQIVVDLKFRGDYTPKTRSFIQKYIASNDTDGFLEILCDKSKWKSVPIDRFKRRIRFFKFNAKLNKKK
jgi:hypothetical protein